MSKQILWLILVFSIFFSAEKDFDDAREEFVNSPKNSTETVLLSEPRYILYPGESAEEGNIGLHLTDWSAFDKTVCGIALIDSEGNVIFGKIPSIAECKSYDGPKRLTEYALGGFW